MSAAVLTPIGARVLIAPLSPPTVTASEKVALPPMTPVVLAKGVMMTGGGVEVPGICAAT